MKIKSQLFLVILGLIALVLSSCNPEEEPTFYGHFSIEEEGESYLKFEPGSYWIYQEQTTGELDTVVLTRYESEMLHFKGERNEYYREHIELTWYANSGIYEFTTGHPYVDLTTDGPLEDILSHFGMPCSRLGIGGVSMIYFPVERPGGGGSVSGSPTMFQGYIDELELDNFTFTEVAEIEVERDWSWDHNPNSERTKYFWKADVGLVQKMLVGQWTEEILERWDLIEYYVTK